MHITINMDGYLANVIDSLIEKGICKTKAEAVRLGLLELNDKYHLMEEGKHFKKLQMKTMAKMWGKEDEIWERYLE